MTARFLFVIIILYGLITYYRLARKRKSIDHVFAPIDALLEKCFDRIPDLTGIVRPYTNEKEIFSRLTYLHTQSYASLSKSEKAGFDRTLTAAKQHFSAIAKNHPELQTAENFMHLRQILEEAEKQLSIARKDYNAAVADYNKIVTAFPSNIIANIFSFIKEERLTIPEGQPQPEGKCD